MPALAWLDSVAQTARVAKTPRCVLCGRNLLDVDDVVQVGEKSFCSHGHFLEYEARPPRRIAHPRPQLIASVLAIIVAGISLFAYLGRSQPAQSGFLTEGSWAEPAAVLPLGGEANIPDVNDFTQTPPTPHRVQISAVGLDVAKRFLSALYVQRNCHAATALAAPGATTFVAGCPAQLEAIKQVDLRLVNGSVRVDTACGKVPGLLWSTQCVAYEEEGLWRSKAQNRTDVTARLARLVVYVWPEGKEWKVVGTGLRSENEGQATEGLRRLWKRTAKPAVA